MLDLRSKVKLCADTLTLCRGPFQIIGIIHDTSLHQSYFMIKVTDFIIGTEVELDDILFGIALLSLCKSAGLFLKITERFDRGPPDQENTGRDHSNSNHQDQDVAVEQDQPSFPHNIVHINIYGSNGNRFIIFIDRSAGRQKPSILTAGNRRRDHRIVFVIRKFFNRSFRSTDGQKAVCRVLCIRIDQTIGDIILIPLNINIRVWERLFHCQQQIVHVFIIIQET